MLAPAVVAKSIRSVVVDKPFSESCVQNREPILAALRRVLPGHGNLLEIGSGTGQHAVYFAPTFSDLTWHTSDRAEYHVGIKAWLEEASQSNIRLPIALDVSCDAWPERQFDAVFSANTAHIMSKVDVQNLFSGVGGVLTKNGCFLLYGPFNVNGNYTAPSNARFDAWLKARDSDMGVRDLEWLQELGTQAGLTLQQSIDMPADNKLLHWIKN